MRTCRTMRLAKWTADLVPWKSTFLVGLGAALLGLGGCETKIGDECSANVDCATDGTRICDRSSPGGYCTIPGCEAGSCPDDSHCISFFPTSFSMTACNPETEDLVCTPCSGPDCNAHCEPGGRSRACRSCDPGQSEDCNAHCDPGPATDDCAPDEICLPEGVCVRLQTERRYCMADCSSDDDCRDGYECRKTGSAGAYVTPKTGEPYTTKRRGFCAPRR